MTDKDCQGGAVRRDDYGFFIGMDCKQCGSYMVERPPADGSSREANHEGAIYSEWECPRCGCTGGHVEAPYREW
jgi:rubredoxin